MGRCAVYDSTARAAHESLRTGRNANAARYLNALLAQLWWRAAVRSLFEATLAVRAEAGAIKGNTMQLKVLAALAAVSMAGAPLTYAARALQPEDWYRFQAVSALTMAADGSAVAYVVTAYDKSADESRDALWIADWSGRHSMRLLRLQGEAADRLPRFTPDGRAVSFLSAPPGLSTQLWSIDRQGGSPHLLSHVP